MGGYRGGGGRGYGSHLKKIFISLRREKEVKKLVVNLGGEKKYFN